MNTSTITVTVPAYSVLHPRNKFDVSLPTPPWGHIDRPDTYRRETAPSGRASMIDKAKRGVVSCRYTQVMNAIRDVMDDDVYVW